MHHFHVYQDFFHNGRPCGTSEVTSIKEAIRLHTARGWNQVCAPYRKRINGQSLLFVEFDTGSLFSTETSVLRFRFSPRRLTTPTPR